MWRRRHPPRRFIKAGIGLFAAGGISIVASLVRFQDSVLVYVSPALEALRNTEGIVGVGLFDPAGGNETVGGVRGRTGGGRGGNGTAAFPAGPWAPSPLLRPSDPSQPTLALIEPFLKGGFRNQAMRFTAFVSHAVSNGIPQILLPSIRWGDRFGTDKPIPFEELFDVEHWNSFAPGLPRLVPYDPAQHYQWNEAYIADRTATDNPTPRKGRRRTQFLVDPENATRPYGHGGGMAAGKLWWEYRSLTDRRARDPSRPRSPVEVLLFRALRPSAKMRSVMDERLPDAVRRGDYMALHPRVEPDMQDHPRCSDPRRYVRELARIFELVQGAFPSPPASDLFLPVNRPAMEGAVRAKAAGGRGALAAENLRALDEALERGLWNGTVRAFEVGDALVGDDARFEGMRSTAGSAINFFLAVRAGVFVGSPVSTWSVDAMAVRYHRGMNAMNYWFGPGGVTRVEGDPRPHNFCS